SFLYNSTHHLPIYPLSLHDALPISAPEKFARIAKLLDRNQEYKLHEHPGKVTVAYVKELAYEIGAPQRLSELGLTEQDAKKISAYAIDDACMITNPRYITITDFEHLFSHAL